MHLEDVDLENAIAHNRQLERPAIKPKEYERFFEHLNNGVPYNKAVAKALPRQCLNQRIKAVLHKLKIGGDNRGITDDEISYSKKTVTTVRKIKMVGFSVITAFYKGNQYLQSLFDIASKNKETFDKHNIEAFVELILVNDSPDYIVETPPFPDNVTVKVLQHEKNAGIHQARITGLENSSGDYIVFLDQDDFLESNGLYLEYMAIADADADVVVANAYIECENGDKKRQYKSRGQFANALILSPYVKAHNQIASPGHCLVKKASIPREWCDYVLKVNGSDDLFLWILMFTQKKKFVKLEKVVYTHRYTGENLSAEETKMATSSLEIARFLDEIAYVPKWVVAAFSRNRRQKIAMAQMSKMEKMKLYVGNLDIYAPRFWWRIRGLVGKYPSEDACRA